jgi:endoglucanase
MGSVAAHSQYVHTQGTEIVDGSGKPLLIRGVSMANWFVLEGGFWGFGDHGQSQSDVEMIFTDLLGPTHAREFLYQWRQNFLSKGDVDRLAQAGFNTIRIPLHGKYFKTDDDEGFKLIDQLAEWCRQDHIYIILNIESGTGGFTAAPADDGPGYPWLLKDAGEQQFVNELWQRIANHYKDDPTILGYDLLNEPLLWPGYLTMENLVEPEYRRVTEAVRKVDSHHMIMLQAACHGSFIEFGRPFDSNTAYVFHTDSAVPNLHWLQQFLDFRSKWQVPVYDGEIYDSKADWETAHVELAVKYNIGWTIWPYKQMGGTGPYIFPTPDGWSKIGLFARQSAEFRAIGDKNAVRPPQEETDAIFAEIIENEKNAHLVVHPEYLQLPGISAH